MQVTTASRLLPYLLLSFVGIAGWSMGSEALLAIVVLGTVGVAIGTAISLRPPTPREVPADQSKLVKDALQDN